MDRKSALKHLLLFGGGLMLMPGCQFDSQRVSVALNNLEINVQQERLLAEIVDTFIPPTNIPGAKDLEIHQFVLVMMDDCRNKEDQMIFTEGLDQVGQLAEDQFGVKFTECSLAQRGNLLSGLMEKEKELEGDRRPLFESAHKSLSMTKQYTIQGFLSSEYVMTEVNSYQMVPGHFSGCVDLS